MIIAITTMIFGCKTNPIGPEQCAALVSIANAIVVEAADMEAGEEQAAKIERYAEIVADLGLLGCSIIPSDVPDPE
jgi:hypothetical protein